MNLLTYRGMWALKMTNGTLEPKFMSAFSLQEMIIGVTVPLVVLLGNIVLSF